MMKPKSGYQPSWATIGKMASAEAATTEAGGTAVA
jgi:hypothetical protein